MLKNIKETLRYKILANDGVIGECKDFLFEDRPWVIRYLVAKPNDWLFSHKVLLPLTTLENPEWKTQLLHVNLTKSQIEKSPPLSEDEPVSREYEKQSFLYYGWPACWEHSLPDKSTGESELRSVNEVTGYTVQGADKRVGQVTDMIIEDNIWAIRYLVVQTVREFGDKKILLAPQWVHFVDWLNQAVTVGLADDAVCNSPDCDPRQTINRDAEAALYKYHGRPYYWDIDSTV